MDGDAELNRTSEEDVRRGKRADVILKDPVFVEACKSLDDQLARLRRQVPVGDTDMHTRLILMEQLKDQLLAYLIGVVQMGEAANHEIKLRDTALEQFGKAMRYGLRNLGVY